MFTFHKLLNRYFIDFMSFAGSRTVLFLNENKNKEINFMVTNTLS
jgi:hypothetical protein